MNINSVELKRVEGNLMKKKHERKQMIALLICISLIIFLLTSLSFVISHTDHNCMGKECSVCIHIQSVNNLMKQLSAGLVQVQNFAIVSVGFFIILLMVCFYRESYSLITLKIRLNI